MGNGEKQEKEIKGRRTEREKKYKITSVREAAEKVDSLALL